MATQWFVYCNAAMNEQVAAMLAEHGMSEDESRHIGIFCSDGVLRDMWEIPPSFINRLRNGTQTFEQLKMRLFKRDAPNERAQLVTFLGRKKQTKKLREAKKRLRQLHT